MRGAPQVEFSATILKIRSRTSFGVCFLPTCVRTLEISFQYKRNPARCHRTTVSGVTIMRFCFQPDQIRRATTQKSLSKRPRIGRGRRRFNTVSCCRSARFSRTRCRRLPNRPASAANKRKSRLNMARSYTRIVDGHSSKLLILRPARVLARDSASFPLCSPMGSAGFALECGCPTQFRLIAAQMCRICNKSASGLVACVHHRNVCGQLHVDQQIQAAVDLIPPCSLLGRDHLLEDRHIFR